MAALQQQHAVGCGVAQHVILSRAHFFAPGLNLHKTWGLTSVWAWSSDFWSSASFCSAASWTFSSS